MIEHAYFWNENSWFYPIIRYYKSSSQETAMHWIVWSHKIEILSNCKDVILTSFHSCNGTSNFSRCELVLLSYYYISQVLILRNSNALNCMIWWNWHCVQLSTSEIRALLVIIGIWHSSLSNQDKAYDSIITQHSPWVQLNTVSCIE